AVVLANPGAWRGEPGGSHQDRASRARPSTIKGAGRMPHCCLAWLSLDIDGYPCLVERTSARSHATVPHQHARARLVRFHVQRTTRSKSTAPSVGSVPMPGRRVQPPPPPLSLLVCVGAARGDWAARNTAPP